MNHIHYTREFEKEIKDDPSKRNHILKQIEKLEIASNPTDLNSFDSYPPKIIVARLSKSIVCRIVIQEEAITVNEKVLRVFFVRQYIGTSELEYKWKNVVWKELRNGRWLDNHPLEDIEKEDFITKYLEDERKNKENPKDLPLDLSNWLNTFKLKLKFDFFEYRDWLEFSTNKDHYQGLPDLRLSAFRELFLSIYNRNEDPLISIQEVDSELNLFWVANSRYGIGMIFQKNSFIAGESTYSIISGTLKEIDREHLIENAQKLLRGKERSLKQTSKDALRAYPGWIINNEIDWISVQRYSGHSNLSLLPEQIDFLKSFSFPSYINGQAGSGKSTMLYYLFANVISYNLVEDFKGNIVFLTENKTLLEQTAQAVTSLLETNPEYRLNLTVKQYEKIKNSFKVFRKFLIDVLPELDRERFPESKYLDFGLFKAKYNADYKQKSHSAEEAWFVLTTYVYGYYSSRVIDSREEYINESNGIPKELREPVPPDRFESIIGEAKPIYDRFIRDGFWTRVELVRYIRNIFPKRIPKANTFVSVFCDEAQDFSRIELQLINDSCIYSYYKLGYDSQIPIVLAGDALQTVSPSGFSDTRLHQILYDVFNQERFKYDKHESTYRPNYNYRSLAPIVNVANLIQQYRKQVLGGEDITIQESKRESATGLQPMAHTFEWLVLPQNRGKFEDKFKYKTFIIPVDLNEESAYIDSEGLLDKETFPQILSSIDAKGAEYSEVVVYGFGEFFLEKFNRNLSQIEPDSFESRFFFNKLYVAITRAQNELVIIDSKAGVNGFWKELIQSQSDHFDSNCPPILFEPQTGLDDILQSKKEDAEENAVQDLDQGLKDKNISRLQVAKSIFNIIGAIEKAYLAEGHIFTINQDYLNAGNAYVQAKNYDLALNSYLTGRHWKKFYQYCDFDDSQRSSARKTIVEVMNSGDNANREIIDLLFDYRGHIGIVLNDLEWKDLFMEQLTLLPQKFSSLESKRKLIRVLDYFAESSEKLMLSLAELYFEDKQYEKAIGWWDKYETQAEKNPQQGGTKESFIYRSRNYIEAKIEHAIDIGNIPDQLYWLGKKLTTFNDNFERTSLGILELGKSLEVGELGLDIVYIRALLTYLLLASILQGKRKKIIDYSIQFEKRVESNFCAKQYAEFLQHDNITEVVAIFLKERFAYHTFKYHREQMSEEKALKLLNDDFYQRKFPYENSNNPWVLNEINSISNTPEAWVDQPEGHISAIEINNFKRFSFLRIDGLNQINLILGDNNTGKTTILESLLFSSSAEDCIKNLLVAELSRRGGDPSKLNSRGILGYFSREGDAKAIRLTVYKNRRVWELGLGSPSIPDILESIGNKYLGQQDQSELKIDPRRYLMVSLDDEKSVSPSIDLLIEQFVEGQISSSNVPLISFGRGSMQDSIITFQNEILQYRKVKEDFFSSMKVFVPNLVDMPVVKSGDDQQINIVEELNGKDIQIPLFKYGEGTVKLFRILLMIHRFKGERLLIDEIDAGIHFSHFKNFWKVILQVANKKDVQIFATTHNEECLKALESASLEVESMKSSISYITMARHLKTGEIIPVIRNTDAIRFASDQDIEVR